jgi:hypothetical protein
VQWAPEPVWSSRRIEHSLVPSGNRTKIPPLSTPQSSCHTVPHHPATNIYKHSPPNSSQVTHEPDIPKPAVFYTPSHLLFTLELQTLRNFIAPEIRTGIWKRQTVETPESSNQSLCNVFARFTSTARTPPPPRPLSAHHNRYQNTSLLPTATFTTDSTPNSHSHDILSTWLRSKSDATVSVPYTCVRSPFAIWRHCAKNVFQSLRLDGTTEVIYKNLQSVTLY